RPGGHAGELPGRAPTVVDVAAQPPVAALGRRVHHALWRDEGRRYAVVVGGARSPAHAPTGRAAPAAAGAPGRAVRRALRWRLVGLSARRRTSATRRARPSAPARPGPQTASPSRPPGRAPCWTRALRRPAPAPWPAR